MIRILKFIVDQIGLENGSVACSLNQVFKFFFPSLDFCTFLKEEVCLYGSPSSCWARPSGTDHIQGQRGGHKHAISKGALKSRKQGAQQRLSNKPSITFRNLTHQSLWGGGNDDWKGAQVVLGSSLSNTFERAEVSSSCIDGILESEISHN